MLDELTRADLCYTPTSFATPEDLAAKARYFDEFKGTVSFLYHFRTSIS